MSREIKFFALKYKNILHWFNIKPSKQNKCDKMQGFVRLCTKTRISHEWTRKNTNYIKVFRENSFPFVANS